jgi:two-component system chemotaxis sensor kinase CheA
VQENAQIIERQLRDLREGVMRVRLVKVGEIFRRMPLAVRDLAREMGKEVRLEIRGQETEIDKFVIERMMDPVLHLVRNAVSHGLETPDQRQAAGKPREGTLTLSAAAVGDSVILEIIDDGRGVDVAAVAARARRAGLLAEDAALDAADVLDVICAPGFSTREETDRASGRGIGMAVVKSTVEDLNGTLSLESTPGGGTRFVIELPVTLSIADALIAHVGDRQFAVPQASVREIIEVAVDAFRAIERHEMVPYRGGSLPVVRLTTHFGLGSAPRTAFHVLVTGAGSDAVGIVVDRVASQQEIVVRSIQDTLARVPGVTGATDLGDGRVVLILDLAALARAARANAMTGLETT